MASELIPHGHNQKDFGISSEVYTETTTTTYHTHLEYRMDAVAAAGPGGTTTGSHLLITIPPPPHPIMPPPLLTPHPMMPPHHIMLPPESDTVGPSIYDLSPPPDQIEPRLLLPQSSNDMEKCISLSRAAMKGDWEAAKTIIDKDPSIVRQSINIGSETVLHVAAAAGQTNFVENLLSLMDKVNDLRFQNQEGNTVLYFAVASGNVSIARKMVEKDIGLLTIRNNNDKDIPLLAAMTFGRREMATYLLQHTPLESFQDDDKTDILFYAIIADYLDVAWKILERNPELALKWEEPAATAIRLMVGKSRSTVKSTESIIFSRIYSKNRDKAAAGNPSSHEKGGIESLWKVIFGMLKTQHKHKILFIQWSLNLLREAAKVGNTELLIEIISSYPELLWTSDEAAGSNDGKSIFHVAVENRQEKVFNLIHEIGGFKDVIANRCHLSYGNMLHLAAQIASEEHLNRVSGAALQMQREFIWFKEVEKVVPPQFVQMSNITQGLTPRDLFSKTHEQLRSDGEKWMKETAQNCMLVAALIATVVFTAIFTVPGGNDGFKGTPILREKKGFSVFVISDVTAMITSSTSILIFLSILTSRYAEEDFLRSLPIKLLLGLTTLLFSIITMVLAFGAAFFMLYDKAAAGAATWVPWTAFVIVFIPVTCFCLLQYKLWMDVFHNTFSLKLHFKKNSSRKSRFHW